MNGISDDLLAAMKNIKDSGIDKKYEAVRNSEELLSKAWDQTKPIALAAILSSLGAAAASGIVEAIKNKSITADIKNNILDFAKSFDKSPDFKTPQEREKAKARLFEIARVAPHVLLNRDLSQQIIKSKLHTGLSSDDRQKLALLQAQFYRGTDISKFLPPMPMAKVGSLLADVVMIKEGSGELNIDSAKRLAILSTIPALAAVAAGAVNYGLAHIKQRDLKKNLEQSYAKALSASDPEKESLIANKDKSRQAFNTLAHFAPHVALDHQAARAFMHKIVSYDQGVDAATIKELSEITKNLSSTSKEHPFVTGLALGSTISGAPRTIGNGVESFSQHLAEQE